MNTAATGSHFRTCPLCEATCGLEIEVVDDRVRRVRGDKEDVFSKGYICPKGSVLGHLHHDPDWQRAPLVRHGERLVPVGWDDAIERVHVGLKAILDDGDPNAVGIYLGNPSVHSLGVSLFATPLIKAFRTRNVFSASTVDQMPRHMSCGLLYGNPNAIPVPDLDRAHTVLILGANPHQSNGSLCTAPDFMGRLAAVRERGGRVIVVDPRRTETAERADEHIAIRPGTDAAWLAALAATLLDETPATNLPASTFAGVERLATALADFTPEAVADWTQIPAATTRRVAAQLRDAPVATVYGRIGVHTTTFGTLGSWLTDVVTILVGGLDVPGGLMFPLSAVARPDVPRSDRSGRGFRTGRWNSRVAGAPEVRGELPASELANEILTPGDGRVRALVTIAGNPARSTPDTRRLDEALASLDFMVSVDPYVNETTRHADVILPPPTPLEKPQFDVAFQSLSVRNVANWSPPVFTPGGLAEHRILATIAMIGAGFDPATTPSSVVADLVLAEIANTATRLDNGPVSGRDPSELVALAVGDDDVERIVDLMVRCGPYGDGFGHDADGVTLQALKEAPHGIDFGPLQPRLDHVVSTPSGRVELAPDQLLDDLDRLRGALGDWRQTRGAPSDTLLLIGRRHLRSNNSWMHNVERLVTGKERCTVAVHPDDAARLGLAEGAMATVASDVGAITLPVDITDEVAPGVVVVPHGWGHDAPGTQLAVAERHAGQDVNSIIPAVIDPLSGNGRLNGVDVTVAPAPRVGIDADQHP